MKASKLYITNDVDYTGVVAKIDRAQSDPATYRYLVDAYKRRRGPNVFMVATCSDSINTSPAMVEKYIDSANTAHAKDLSKLKDDISMVDLELDNVKAKYNQSRTHKDWDTAEEFQKRMEDLE
ncbi:tat pathway signal sequence [Neofusicoccum parvum]|uniref:Tat pathway signal sequence n=1 Tax=Neofusicoccum parvum TaxID=310453 RepID=A0ACB5S4P7_9PEZI|nr:tat pathway signal sequence [Neofusicoccum parvum]